MEPDAWYHFAVTKEPGEARVYVNGDRVLTAPTLFLYGDKEPYPVGADPEWVWDVRDARLLLLPDVGHLPWLEDPDTFFPAAEAFLAGAWPPGSQPVP